MHVAVTYPGTDRGLFAWGGSLPTTGVQDQGEVGGHSLKSLEPIKEESFRINIIRILYFFVLFAIEPPSLQFPFERSNPSPDVSTIVGRPRGPQGPCLDTILLQILSFRWYT